MKLPITRRQVEPTGLTDELCNLAGPSALRIGATTVELPAGLCSSFAIAGYPREIGAGWLEPLLTYPGRLDVSLHVEPIPPLVAAQRLRRQLARLQSSSRSDAEHGRLVDYAAQAAAEDAAELAASLARGRGRLFRVGLYLSVHAEDPEELQAQVQRVKGLAASMLLDAQPTTFRALQGWVATLPLAADPIFPITPATILRWHRNLAPASGPTPTGDGPADPRPAYRLRRWSCGWPAKIRPGVIGEFRGDVVGRFSARTATRTATGNDQGGDRARRTVWSPLPAGACYTQRRQRRPHEGVNTPPDTAPRASRLSIRWSVPAGSKACVGYRPAGASYWTGS